MTYAQSAPYAIQSTAYAMLTSIPTQDYASEQLRESYMIKTPEFGLHFEAAPFLATDRPATPIISCADEVKDMIVEAFEKSTGQEFPEDGIRVQVLALEEFKKAHERYGPWSDGIMGFSINRHGRGVSDVVVREDNLDRLMLTIGHELGHVLSRTLPNAQDEEAKAHAFSLAWMETIREHDIGGLRSNIVPNPARNGLHDVAFDFVNKLLAAGMSAKDIFLTLSQGLMSIIGG